MPQSLSEKLADHFRRSPGRWIDGRELATIAGSYAWRTRVADLRRAPFLMTIENQQRRVMAADGTMVTISEYRYMPANVSLIDMMGTTAARGIAR